MEDKFGRPYAKLSELKAGDWAELDDGFTCAPAGPVLLQADDKGKLYFACCGEHDHDEGIEANERHYVAGQADDGEHCVGVYIIDVAAVS